MDIFPAILKPNSEGSSLGVEKVEKPEDLEQARRKVIEFGEKMLLEKFVSGREFTCAVLQLGPSEPPVRYQLWKLLLPTGTIIFIINTKATKLNTFAPKVADRHN